jgi:hypothetical protein
VSPERPAGGYSPWTTRRNGLFRALPGFMEVLRKQEGRWDMQRSKLKLFDHFAVGPISPSSIPTGRSRGYNYGRQ